MLRGGLRVVPLLLNFSRTENGRALWWILDRVNGCCTTVLCSPSGRPYDRGAAECMTVHVEQLRGEKLQRTLLATLAADMEVVVLGNQSRRQCTSSTYVCTVPRDPGGRKSRRVGAGCVAVGSAVVCHSPLHAHNPNTKTKTVAAHSQTAAVSWSAPRFRFLNLAPAPSVFLPSCQRWWYTNIRVNVALRAQVGFTVTLRLGDGPAGSGRARR